MQAGRALGGSAAATMQAPKRVLILGAGWAGLSAARALLEEAPPGSVSVIILEATDAVGGRSRTAVLPLSGPVELGATWFHGTKGNPIYDFAIRQGVVIDPQRAAEIGFKLAGAAGATAAVGAAAAAPRESWGVELSRPGTGAPERGPARAAAVAAMGLYGDTIEEIGEEGEGGADVSADVSSKSFGDYLRPAFDEAVASQDAESGARAAFAEGWACRERLQRAYDGFHSCDAAGAAFAVEYEELEGPNIPVPGGYQHLAELMAAGLDIRLNTPVLSIRWGLGASGAAGAAAASASGAPAGPVGVVTAAGEEIAADAVVCTFSLGVLKAAVAAAEVGGAGGGGDEDTGVVRFEPPLPESKVAAIRSLQIGLVNKLFIEFDPPASPPPGGNPVANGAAAPGAAEGGGGEGGEEAGEWAPQPPPLAYSSRPHGVAAAQQQQQEQEEEALIGPRRRVQASAAAPRPPPGGLAATATPEEAGAAAAAAAVAGGEGAGAAGGGEAGAESTPPAARPKLTSYCLLWPTSEALWGAAGAPSRAHARPDPPAAGAAGGDLLPLTESWRETFPDLPEVDPAYLGPAVAGPNGDPLPGWLYGLHSWRYSDGPEWCKPLDGYPAAAGDSAAADGAGAGAAGGVLFEPRRAHWRGLWEKEWPGRGGYCAVLWVCGRAALALEALSDGDITADVAALLGAFPSVPRPPGAGTPARVLRSGWCASPYFRGSYSYPGAGASGDAMDALAAPLPAGESESSGGSGGGGGGGGGGGLLCFAGEATSRTHTGCVHGAYLSGRREARRLISHWGLALGA